MDSSANTNLLYEIINNCTQAEFSQAPLASLKTAHTALGFKNSTKKKEELINDIYRYLSNILVRQGSTAQMRDGFPLFNHNNEFFQKNPNIKHLVELCNQKIHIANIQLAQVNYNKLNQFKKAMNLSDSQSLCICDQPVNATDAPESLIKCINSKCGRSYHRACMKVGPSADDYPLFECPECILSKCDPLHEVIKALVNPFIVDNIAREFKIDQMLYREVKDNEDLGIEVRCIRLENQSHEQCWPHQGELEMNQSKLLEFKPLQLNSSLKRRKDEKFFSSDVKSGSNSVQLKYVKGSDPRNPDAEETYVAAVYLVKKITCETLVQNIKAESKRSVEDCKKMLAEEIANSSIDIDKVICPLTCVFDMQTLKTPAKGAYCKHPNCFSLENFVNLWYKNNQRKWTCPICKVKSYDLIVDSYFEEILQDAKRNHVDNTATTNVQILRDGSYKFVKEETQNEEDPELRAQIKLEKPAESSNLIVLDDDSEEEKDKEESKINQVINGGADKGQQIETEEPVTAEAPPATATENKPADADAMEEEEEELPQRPQGGLVVRDKSDQSKTLEERKEEAVAGAGAGVMQEEIEDQKEKPEAINIEDSENSRPIIETLPTAKSSESQRKPEESGKGDAMEEESEKAAKKKERGRKKKESSKNGQAGQAGQMDSLQAALEQYQQLQASEGYKLQQLKQQQLLQQQNLMLEALVMKSMQGMPAMQQLQAMNMANMMRQYGGAGAAGLIQQQNMFNLMANMMTGNLLQQQMGMGGGSMDDMAAMLLASYGGGGMDQNYMANMMRNLNELNSLQALKMNNQNFLNSLGGGGAAATGLAGQGVTGLDALLLSMKNAEQQQQQQSSGSAASNARNQSTLSNPVKAPKSNKSISLNEEDDEPQIRGNPTPPVEVKPVVYLRRDDGRPKKFKVERERPQTRVLNDAEKSLEKLMELSEIKLDLPKFANWKEVNTGEPKKEKEFNLQKNKKFVAMVMKQFPLHVKPANKPGKPAEGGTEMNIENSGANTVTMETEEREVDQQQQQQSEIAEKTETTADQTEKVESTTEQSISKAQQGQESDPICLE